MNCENCGAPLITLPGKDYLFCDHCSSFYFPDKNKDSIRVLGDQTEFNCPVCQKPLVTASIEEGRVLTCPGCRGVLVQQEAFFQIITLLRSTADNPAIEPRRYDDAELNRQLLCPNCKEKMDTHPYLGPGNVVIDTCSRCCLIWLDHGEIEKIVDSPGRDRRIPD